MDGVRMIVMEMQIKNQKMKQNKQIETQILMRRVIGKTQKIQKMKRNNETQILMKTVIHRQIKTQTRTQIVLNKQGKKKKLKIRWILIAYQSIILLMTWNLT